MSDRRNPRPPGPGTPRADDPLRADPAGLLPPVDDRLDADDADLRPTLPEEYDEDQAERFRWVLSRDAKLRLDKYLQNRVKNISRNQIQKLIALGGVTVNRRAPKASQSLKQGDVVEVILPPKPATDLSPEPIPLHVLYEDDDMIVINKQAGLVVHPARSHLRGTLLNALAYHFAQQRDRLGADPGPGDPDAPGHGVAGLSRVGIEDARPGVVHRLDKNTTGVIVIAKRDESHWLIARQFEYRTNLKAYLAVVHGCPDPPMGEIDQPIGKHRTIREAYCVRHDAYGKPSQTIYRVRERYRGYSLVELELKTGRTHQIRVHLSYLGRPIVGDLVYGGEAVGAAELADPPHPAGGRPHVTYARDKEQGQRLAAQAADRPDVLMATPALHAALLRLDHPVTREPMTFTAPVHRPMLDLIHRLRQQPEPGPVVERGFYIDLTQAVGQPDPGPWAS